mgnify:CR=1 FL=1
MNKKWLLKIGAPALALTLVTACANDDEENPPPEENNNTPVEDEAPLTDDNAPADEIEEEMNDITGDEGNDGLGNNEDQDGANLTDDEGNAGNDGNGTNGEDDMTNGENGENNQGEDNGLIEENNDEEENK